MTKILGIDLGTGSIGTALRNIEAGENIIDQMEYFSVDIFQSGVGMDKTGEYSLAAERTQNRQSRRLKETRRRRLWATLQLLIENDLCPMSMDSLNKWKTYNKSANLYRTYPIEDKGMESWIKMDFNNDGLPDYKSPYQLRRELATVPIDFSIQENRYKLGRALYHIAQRRGFKSSKGETISSQEKDSKETLDIVEDDISQEMQKSESNLSKTLLSYMEEHNLQTIGIAFANLEDEGERIRNSKYVAVRKQYEEEISYIFNFQHDLSIESELYKRLISKKKNIGTIFYKKQLRSQKWAVGKCTLETNKTRCPISHPEFEKFRAWCFINNIKFRKDIDSDWQQLPDEVKSDIFKTIFTRRIKTDFLFKDIRERVQVLLGFSLNGDCEKENRTINYKDSQRVSGCPVIARLINLLGNDWETFCMNGTKKRTTHSKSNITTHIVEYSALDIWHICYETDDPEYLTEFSREKLKWDDEQTKKLVRLWSTIRPGYAMLSLKAIKNINHMLSYGLIYSDAVLLAKIPEFVQISDDDIKNMISEYHNNVKAGLDDIKLVYGITNSLIANYKSLDIKKRFAFHDNEYKLTELDYKDITKQIIKTIGAKSWKLFSDSERLQLFNQVCDKYQQFFYDIKRDFYKMPKLSDRLKQYLIDKFPDIPKGKWDKLYHPSQISIYHVYKTNTDKSELRLGSPSIGAMRNPVARRTLNILRRKINSMLDAGMIDSDDTRIVIETTRSFNDANKRWAIEAYQRERENENKAIKELLQELFPSRIITDCDIDSVRYLYEQPRTPQGGELYKEAIYKYKDNKNKSFGIDVEKYKLWKEQGGMCLYTGNIINLSQLFDESSYDIEHTIPRSLSFDSSDKNLTICDSYYNRFIKKNQIPTELPNYEVDAIVNGTKYTAIKPRLKTWEDRVERLQNNVDFWKTQSKRAFDKSRKDYCIRQRHLWQMELDYWKAKLERFTLTEVKEGFRNSQLVDTGIITKYATLYLKTIFNNVDVQKGVATAEFRKMLGIQSIDEKKNRSIHSHHAVDATVLTLIPVAAKRQRMLKLFYDIEEAEAQKHDASNLKKELKEEIDECTYGQNIGGVPDYIEKHIIIKHNSTDRTFSCIKYNKKSCKYNSNGDVIRGRLHKEKYFGAVRLPKELGCGIEKTYETKNGEFIYSEDSPITMVIRTLLTDFTSEKDFECIIDPNIRRVISTIVHKRLESGLSFKEAINQPVWMLDKCGNEIKQSKDGTKLCPIRHVRCKVKAGRGYMTREKSIEIRQHIFSSSKKNINISDKSYKQFVYAQNDTNYLYLLYEGIKKGCVDRKSRIINLWEATLLHRNEPEKDIDNIIRDTLSYNQIIDKKIEYKLSAIIRVGYYVLLWNETPDELKELDAVEISKRLYIVVKFNTTGADLLYLRNHLSADISPDINLVANKVNCLIEHRDFNIDTLGKIHFLD